jgi:hypothetical protein
VIAAEIPAQGANMTTMTQQTETAPASTEPKPIQQPRAAKPGANVAPKRVKATFTIDSENNVTAHAGLPPAGANEPFANLKDLTRLTAKWPTSRLVDIWNSFAGVAPFNDLKPVKKFTNRDVALARIWEAVERLAPMVTPSPVAQPAHDVAGGKKKATKPATEGKRGDTARRGAKSAKRAAPATRDGSKAAKILDLLKRPGGATSKELQKASGWQPHSVRGFLSGTVGKKMGLTVVSAKGEDGERSYSVKS